MRAAAQSGGEHIAGRKGAYWPAGPIAPMRRAYCAVSAQ